MSCHLLLLRFRFASRRRCFSTASSAGERLRIAIVGGGAAGLSSALHLAPLVERGLVASPIDVYEPSRSAGRDIGVGLWSTALEPFRTSERNSHQLLWNDLMHSGTFVTDVGYRTPNGTWLAKSQLPNHVGDDMEMPALLFLREKDMLTALRRAVHLEEHQGTVQIHKGDSSRITGIVEEASPHAYSSCLVGALDNTTDRDYHLIVAADGMHSSLRQKYAGHRQMKRLTGTAAIDAAQQQHDNSKDGSWDAMGQADANAIEDRKYTVFRGNADLTKDQTGVNVSFQTWGTGNSMRFATVPMSYPSGENKRTEKQVWFITTSDDSIAQEEDPVKRRDLLLNAFANWHSPICELIQATPPEEILHERAMAHKHCVGPVLNVNRDLKQYSNKPTNSGGPGPAICFVGDAFMTVDPILAQGFTIAMEGAYQLAVSVEKGSQSGCKGNLAFDPFALRKELLERFDQRYDRLLGLLRATELVQAMGQPSSGVTGIVSQSLVRPIMKLSPDFVKTPMFNAVLRYSLGLPLRSP
jgi:2-polyprenyl-6-methoxyphenol hydroxylase-like FAD-dependent oxidoreductase